MRKMLAFVKKEFRHILRDRRTLLLLFGMPIIQILLFGFALTNEIKNARIAVLDAAKDPATLEMIAELEASTYFDLERDLHSAAEIEGAFLRGEIKMAIIFPPNFRETLLHENRAQIQLIADASDPNAANVLTVYAASILTDYQMRLRNNAPVPLSIEPEMRMLYNPQLKASYNFVPGVMGMILLLVCAMMTSIAIVREKELGTMEILLVSPMQPLMVVISKAIPYLVLSLVNVTSILLLSVFVLDLPILGSIPLFYAESFLYILTCLSLGLLISTRAQSQQTAMLISMMGLMMPTIMFSGFMFPIENMPVPMQVITNIVPAKWFFIIIKNVMLKGLGFASIWKETLILAGMTVFFIAMAIRNFKIRLA